nr:hypothetical protein [Tanacetum cinerariifolium]
METMAWRCRTCSDGSSTPLEDFSYSTAQSENEGVTNRECYNWRLEPKGTDKATRIQTLVTTINLNISSQILDTQAEAIKKEKV